MTVESFKGLRLVRSVIALKSRASFSANERPKQNQWHFVRLRVRIFFGALRKLQVIAACWEFLLVDRAVRTCRLVEELLWYL